MSVPKKQKKSTPLLASFQEDLDDYAKGLRRDFEVMEWVRKGPPKPLDLAIVELEIETLKKSEKILSKAADRYGYSARKINARRTAYQPSFITKRRLSAIKGVKAEIRRLSALHKRRLRFRRGLNVGRPSDPLWGYRAQCLMNFIKERTGKKDWNLVGETLLKHFPEMYRPPERPYRNTLGPWANKMAIRYRKLFKNNFRKYLHAVTYGPDCRVKNP